MPDAAEESVLPSSKPMSRYAWGWQIIWFLFHLAVVYSIANFCTPWLAGWIRATLLPLLQIPTSSDSRFEFLFSHLFGFSFAPAFLAGLFNARFKHKVAQWVWLVPTVILAYKLIVYPTQTSLLQSHFWSAFHQYFEGGFLVPEFRNWRDLRMIMDSNPDMARGLAQLSSTAPFYAGLAYSLAAWICLRTELDRRLIERVKMWEERKFEVRP